jgi:hypothetical protein
MEFALGFSFWIRMEIWIADAISKAPQDLTPFENRLGARL